MNEYSTTPGLMTTPLRMRIIEGWRRRRKEEPGEGGRGEERMKFGILGYKIHTRHPRADMEKAGEYMYQNPRKRYSYIDYVRSDHLKMTE